MADREQLPDIMSGLLGGKAKQAEAPEPAAQPASKPAKRPASRTVRQKASKAPPPPDSEEKAKATFYLSQETVDLLEDGWLRLRRLATDRASVSKSAIVEAALEIALEDLAKYGEQSELASKLAYP